MVKRKRIQSILENSVHNLSKEYGCEIIIRYKENMFFQNFSTPLIKISKFEYIIGTSMDDYPEFIDRCSRTII